MAKLKQRRQEDSAKESDSASTDREQAEERQAIGANVVYEAIRLEGEEELRRPAAALAWSGLAAGLSMGFSFIAEAILTAHLPDTPWRPLVSRAGYCIGFLIVILGRQQLFTENTLTAILPLLARKNFSTLVRVLRLWGTVLTANLAGTFFFALCVARIKFFDGHVQAALLETAKAHIGVSFGIVMARAIFAGWLIALMVWLLPAAESARVSIIIIVTYLVGIGDFNHIVAGSTTALFLVFTKSISFAGYFVQFFIPTLIGNIIGGVSLVAALGHAQVVGGKH